VNDLNREDFSAMPDDSVNEPDRDLSRPECSTKLEATINESARDLKSEACSAKLAATVNELARDLNREVCSAKPEATVNELDNDLNSESCLAMPEVRAQVAVKLVEHERGLELQVSDPEFTFATMLPIVNAIEAANVLKIEDFSARLAAKVNELVRDLNSAVCSTNAEATVNEPDRDRKREDFSAKPEAMAIEAVGP